MRNPGWVALAIVVLVPALLFFVLRTGKTHYKRLPILGPHEVQGNDTLWHKVPAFAFPNQDSTLWGSDSLKGKIAVVDFIFTRCTGICPRLSAAMQEIHQAYQNFPDIRFVSFSVDPEYDTPSVLREYAAKYNASPQWQFLWTQDRKQVYELAVKGLLVPMDYPVDTTQGEMGIVHTNLLILIDKDRHLRGFYDGLNPQEVKKLKEEILLLRKEYENL
ncbi:MAG: SCO family protein [Bacteroidia bacterium]